MLDVDPENVGASIKLVDDVASRTVLRLGLLRTCLRPYEAAPKPQPQLKPDAKPPSKAAITEKK